MANELERLRTALANRYRLDRELGRGGMAMVFLAEDVKHSRSVAVKVLKPELAQPLIACAWSSARLGGQREGADVSLEDSACETCSDAYPGSQ